MEADNQMKINQGAFQTKKTSLEESISTLSKKHQDLLAEHRQKEQELRKVIYCSMQFMYCSCILLAIVQHSGI